MRDVHVHMCTCNGLFAYPVQNLYILVYGSVCYPWLHIIVLHVKMRGRDSQAKV